MVLSCRLTQYEPIPSIALALESWCITLCTFARILFESHVPWEQIWSCQFENCLVVNITWRRYPFVESSRYTYWLFMFLVGCRVASEICRRIALRHPPDSYIVKMAHNMGKMSSEILLYKLSPSFVLSRWLFLVVILLLMMLVSIISVHNLNTKWRLSHTTIDWRELGIPSALPYISFRSAD